MPPLDALRAARQYVDRLTHHGDHLAFPNDPEALVPRPIVLEAILKAIDAAGSLDPDIFGPLVQPLTQAVLHQLIDSTLDDLIA